MRPAEINWNRLPVYGIGGLIFALGLCLVIAVAFPVALELFLPAMAVGALVGLLLGYRRSLQQAGPK